MVYALHDSTIPLLQLQLRALLRCAATFARGWGIPLLCQDTTDAFGPWCIASRWSAVRPLMTEAPLVALNIGEGPRPSQRMGSSTPSENTSIPPPPSAPWGGLQTGRAM